jgi:glycosyltransferase involved in cell wall biosynthesis
VSSIDVAIPNYNYGRFLRACVESVLAQDVDDLRVLIVDNASTDDSAGIARRLAAADPRIELRLRSENLGPHASFNEGIDWAKGDYFLILCSDDLLAPGALRRAVTIMNENPGIAMTYGRDVQVRDNAPPAEIAAQPERPRWRLRTGLSFIEGFCRLGVFQLPGPSLIVRTSAQKAVGYYRPELPHSDDYDVWLRLAMQGNVAELDCIQAMIREHGQNRSSEIRARQVMHIRETEAAVRCFFSHEGADLPQAAALKRMALRGLGERAYWAAISGLIRGERGMSELLSYAFKLRPLAAIVPPLGYLLSRPDTAARIKATLAGWTRLKRRHA